MLTDSKIFKLAFKTFSFFCVIAAIVCLICNLAINKSITWASYPLAALPFAWVIATPALLFKKYKVLFSLAAFSVFCLPFLYILERVTPVNGWFAALGVPAAITSIIAVWITYFLIKYVKLNWWYMSAALFFLYGVVVSAVVNYFTFTFLDISFFKLSNIINILSCAVVVALLVIIGYYKNANKILKTQQQEQETE